MLWRRFLVKSDSTLADLHVVLQIGFDWTKEYAVPRLGGLRLPQCTENQARRLLAQTDDE
jgi:hypothetical protein